MGVQLARNKPDYPLYVGADLTTALTIANLHTLIKLGYLDRNDSIIRLAFENLQQKRIAFFGVTIDNLTKVSLALGDTSVYVDTSEEE
jgi:hypothetical protein